MSLNGERAVGCGVGGVLGGHLVKHVAEEIAGVRLERKYTLNALKGVNARKRDHTKIVGYPGWEPSVRLKEGLAKAHEWIDEQTLAGVSK